MSNITRFFGALMLLGAAGPALSLDTQPPAPEATALPPMGVMVADATGRTVLSDRDIRRMNHFAAQTMAALWELGSSSNATAVLRQRVQRMVDAGARSGMDMLQTADYFQAYLAQNNTRPLPGVLLDGNGNFNARGLITATVLYQQGLEGQEVDVAAVDEADLAAIGSVAKRLAPQAPPAPQTLQLSVTVLPDETAALPPIPADAPADVRAILERVRVQGENWVITVEPGDSLGQYANALYGDTLLFERIFNANLDVLATPNSITVGQQLVLPRG